MQNNETAKTKSVPRLVLLTLVVVVSLGALLFTVSSRSNCSQITRKKICLEIVTTQEDKQTGMSKYSSYSCGRGMLFDFGQVGNYGIWMKDMKISLDIAWLDESKKIIKVEKNVSPDTYPKSFGDDVSSRYVLEVLPGCYELGVGQELDI